jgi:hypothetical protein
MEPSTTHSTSTATAHLSSKHLHENLGIDIHASTHSATTEALHWIHEIFTTVVPCTLPVCALVSRDIFFLNQ